jgi:RNA polymerase sigma-70 factor, ECF subfamily
VVHHAANIQTGADLPERGGEAVADEALVAAAKRDQRAFEALYTRYVPRVYRYARARVTSDVAAADIVSETMLDALEGLERFDPASGTFAGWLFTIAARRIVDRQRRRGRLLRVLPRVWEPDATREDALDAIDASDDIARLQQQLRRLPAQDRDIVLLRYNAELSSAEIGQVLGMKAGAVRVRLMRTLQRLARELNEELPQRQDQEREQ